jgi:phosphoribosylformimino-5-aminoimidazole carboxamide ribotide isomerase
MSPERRKPRLIPVLDVMGGVVVRAHGGRREEYRPLVSKLTNNCDPVQVLRALEERTSEFEIYIADLDAIRGNGEISTTLSELIERNHSHMFWIDAGLRSRESFKSLPYRPDVWPVIASETAASAATAEIIASMVRGDRFAFSIDLREGKLLCDWLAWGLRDHRDAIGLVRQVIDLGVSTLIVLDLARVGTGTGSGTEPLLKAIRDEFPCVELIAGGGVRTWADIDRLGEAGADAVLVASALHDGTITFPRPM